MSKIPDYWTNFLNANNLRGITIEIPEEIDLSELGTSCMLYDEKNILEEMNEFYPGLVVKDDNYIPIGCCLNGSGDPYFINSNDGAKGKLYRIYHDEFSADEYDKDSAIDTVLNNYEDMLLYKE